MNINSLDDILQIKDADLLLSDEVFEFLLLKDIKNLTKNRETILNHMRKNNIKCINGFKSLLNEKKTELCDNAISTFEFTIPDTNEKIKIKTREYYIDQEGFQIVKKVVYSNGKEKYNVPICKGIVIPVSMMLDITDENNCKKMDVIYYDNDYKWKKQTVTQTAVTTSKELINQIGKNFVAVTTNNMKDIIDFFQEVINLNGQVFFPKEAISYFGWKNKRYMGDDVFLPYNNKYIYCGADDKAKRIMDSLNDVKGTLDEWVKFTTKLRKHLPCRMAMAASFSAPLLQLLDMQSFTVLLHGTSGLGKSHWNFAAMSVWGRPDVDTGLTFSMSETKNALPRLLSTFKNVPACLDELKLYEGNLNDLMYEISIGTEKGRLKGDKENGGLKSDSSGQWRTIVLLSGEQPILCETSDEGAVNRLIQILATDRPDIDIMEMKDFLREQYGTAGRAYINHIKNINVAQLRIDVNNLKNEICSKTNTSEKQALMMAVLLTGDKISSNLFYENEPAIEIEDIEKFLFSSKEISIGYRAYRNIISLVAQNEKKFYKVYDNDNQNGDYINDREFWGEIDDKQIKILKPQLDLLLTKMFSVQDKNSKKQTVSPTQIYSEWDKNGILEKTSAKKPRYYHSSTVRGHKGDYIWINIIDNYDDGLQEEQEELEKQSNVIKFQKQQQAFAKNVSAMANKELTYDQCVINVGNNEEHTKNIEDELNKLELPFESK